MLLYQRETILWCASWGNKMTGYTKRAVRNSLSTALQIPIKLFVGLFLPPFILSKLGVQQYGAWVLVMAVGAYISMIDAGVTTALVKYTAEHYAHGNFDELSEIVWSALIYFAAAGAAVILVLFLSGNGIIAFLFNKSTLDAPALKILLVTVGIVYILNMCGGVFASVLTGMQRLEIFSFISIIGMLANAVTVIILLIAGWKIWSLAVGWAVGVAVLFAGSAICAFRLVPAIIVPRIRGGIHVNMARLLRLGSGDLSVRLSAIFVNQLDKFLLGRFAGLNWVAFYDLAFGLITQLRNLPGAIFSAFIPMASELKAKGGHANIEKLYHRGLRYLNVCGLPIFIFVIVFAYPVVRVWLGGQYSAVAWALQFLAASNYLNLLTGPAYTISLGLGQPRIGIYFSLVLTGLTVFFSTILIPIFGYKGAVFSYTVVASTSAIFLIWNFHQRNKMAFRKIYFNTLVFPCILVAVTAIAVKFCFYHFSYGLSRLTTGIVLAGSGSVFLLLCILLMWKIRLVGREEWALVWEGVRLR